MSDGGDAQTLEDVQSGAMEEGATEAMATMIAADEPTADDLREFYGEDAEGMSDEDLLSEFANLQGSVASIEDEGGAEGAAVDATDAGEGAGAGAKADATGTADEATTTAPEPVDFDALGFSLIDQDGEPLSAEDARAAVDLLQQLKVSYKVDGQERSDALQQLIRLAQAAPHSDRIATQLRQMATENAKRLEEVQRERDDLQAQSRLWSRALADPTGQLIQQLQEQYQQALLTGEAPTAAQAAAAAHGEGQPGDVTSTPEYQRGLQFYNQQVMPYLQQVAQEYAPDPSEVPALTQRLDATVKHMIEQEGALMGNREYAQARLAQILQRDLVAAVESAGYKRGAGAAGNGAAAAPNSELAALRRQMKAMQLELQKAKLAQAPDAGSAGGPAGPGSSGSVGSVDSWSAMKDKLADPNETFGI